MGINKEVFIEQYLSPNYWDGHTIGLGDDTGVAIGITQGAGEASRRLWRCIAPRIVGDPFSLQSFRQGAIFNPADFEVGTIVSQKGEMIAANRGVSVDIDSLEGIPPPPLNALVHRSYKSANGRSMVLTSKDKGLKYQADTFWGVVVDTSDNERGLAYVDDKSVRNLLGGLICKTGMITAQTSPITMGKVEHRHANGKLIKECVWRIQSADIVAYGGNVQTQENYFATIIGRFRQTAFDNLIVLGE